MTWTELKSTLREREVDRAGQGVILMSRRHLNEEGVPALARQSQDRRIPMAKLAESIIQTDEYSRRPNQAGVAGMRPR